MMDHQGQIIVPTTMERESFVVSPVIFCLLAFDAVDVKDDDNLVTALSAQI